MSEHIENLFKHNIFFTPFNEHITDYISINRVVQIFSAIDFG